MFCSPQCAPPILPQVYIVVICVEMPAKYAIMQRDSLKWASLGQVQGARAGREVRECQVQGARGCRGVRECQVQGARGGRGVRECQVQG